MIDKEKNNARYRLSHCVNVLFSVDHGTFRWRREDKSRGLFTKIQGQTDIDSRFGQMVSKIHDWQISSFNLVDHLHKSNPFSQKTATKAWGRWMSRFLPPHFFVGTLWSFCRSLWKRIPTSCLLRVLIHRGGGRNKNGTSPGTGIKGDFDEMEHEFQLGTFGTEKRYLFFSEILLLTEVFLIGMTWKVMFHLLANWICWKLFAYGKQLRSLPRDMFM